MTNTNDALEALGGRVLCPVCDYPSPLGEQYCSNACEGKYHGDTNEALQACGYCGLEHGPGCPVGRAWDEYDYAAEWCAKRGLRGAIGDPLPTNLSGECFRLINDDPEAFERRVSETAYGLASETRDALQRAVEYLGAKEVAPGRYAFADGWTGCGDGKRWLFVPAEGLSCLPKTGYLAWRSMWTKPAPPWWSPGCQYAYRILMSDGAVTGSRFTSWTEANERQKVNCPQGSVERITADLTTGEEKPA